MVLAIADIGRRGRRRWRRIVNQSKKPDGVKAGSRKIVDFGKQSIDFGNNSFELSSRCLRLLLSRYLGTETNTGESMSQPYYHLYPEMLENS
jgi:hypothetical protein